MVYPSLCEWKDVDNFFLTPNILFNFLVNSTANCGFLSDITLSGNLCNFHILSLNNLAKSSTNIPSVAATKCAILDNLLQTTKITSIPTTNSNLVIKSTIECIYSFLGILFAISFPTSTSIFSSTCHIYLHIFSYSSSLLATNNSLSPTLLSSIFLYVLLLAHHGVTGLFLLSISHPLAYISFIPLMQNSLLLATHLLLIS